MAEAAEDMLQAPAGAPARQGRPRYDMATVLGLGGGLLLLVLAVLLGGSPGAFFDFPSVLIVLGGTLAVTTVCFSLPEMARTATVLRKTVLQGTRDPSHAAIRVIRLAEQARKHGILGLQDAALSLRSDPFLEKGVAMVVDGTPGDEVEVILKRELQAMNGRHHKAAGILRKAAEIAPAMGLIGTLIGLVQMLGHLDDPSAIGPSMAVALLTTFYGAVLANMVFSPLAAKLERNTAEEILINQLYVMGVVSISRQENPRRLEMLLNSLLPPSKRVRYFD